MISLLYNNIFGCTISIDDHLGLCCVRGENTFEAQKTKTNLENKLDKGREKKVYELRLFGNAKSYAVRGTK